MQKSELVSIKESIERTERFGVGYPRLIEDVDEKWKIFFEWEHDLCMHRARFLGGVSLAKRGVDNSSQLPLVDI